jgi:threonine 3-dehydrogenase
MMQAVRKLKEAPGFDLVEVPIPTPGPGEVLVKILAASLCGTDGKVKAWLPPFSAGRLKPPVTTGHEMSGVIVELGEGVTGFAVGDLVSAESHIPCQAQSAHFDHPCSLCQEGNEHICSHVKFFSVDRDGFLANYATSPTSVLWKNDRDMDPSLAALQESLGNSVYTVMEGDVKGKNVAIFGMGPTGLNAAAICKHMQAKRIIAVAGSALHLQMASTMGADVVINRHDYKTSEELIAAIGALVPEVHVCLEMSGSPQALQQALQLVRPTGVISILGLYKHDLTVDMNAIVLKDLKFRGIYGRRMWETWKMTSQLLREGLAVRPVITHTFEGLTQWEEGFRLMEEGACGKVMFYPNGKPNSQ